MVSSRTASAPPQKKCKKKGLPHYFNATAPSSCHIIHLYTPRCRGGRIGSDACTSSYFRFNLLIILSIVDTDRFSSIACLILLHPAARVRITISSSSDKLACSIKRSSTIFVHITSLVITSIESSHRFSASHNFSSVSVRSFWLSHRNRPPNTKADIRSYFCRRIPSCAAYWQNRKCRPS